MTEISIDQIIYLSDRAAQQIEDIYTGSFPSGERVAFSELRERVRRAESLLFLGRLGDAIAGFVFLSPLQGVHHYLLEYMAVAEEVRSRGVGSMLLKYLQGRLMGEKKARGILLEVDSPWGRDLSPEERDLRQRRIKFYIRNGAFLINTGQAYCIPDFTDRSKQIPMELMRIPLLKTELVPLEVKDCIYSILTQIYGLQVDDHMLQSVLDEFSRQCLWT